MKLSDNLKSIRKQHNLSQEQLAEKLGVSRQAVSKWESGLSYPEMDKVLLICKLFNYNIDELMNENVKEVDETKQSKININKYIDDFFGFITKTVEMFSSMTFKQKLKCFIEQIWIIVFLILIFLIIGAIGSTILSGIFNGLPIKIYYFIRNVFQSIYLILSLILGITVILHIFKIRYLDYYEVIKEDEDTTNHNFKEENDKENANLVIQNSQQEQENTKKILIGKKKEKIIIRDPKHSQSKFLTGIFRLILGFIKFMTICLSLVFIASFIFLIATLVLSFLFTKTGMVFVGAFLGLLSAICINFIILELLYNFIVNKKSKKTRIALCFIVSLVIAGISIGLIFIGITQFNYNDNPDVGNTLEHVKTISMTDNLSIECYYPNVEYIATDSNEIKIVVKHSKYYTPNVDIESDENVQIYLYNNESSLMEFIRDNIDDINNKEIKNYYNPKVYIYASQENIDKINQNKKMKENRRLENTIEQLHEDNNILQNEVFDLQQQIQEKEDIINDLEMKLHERIITE